MYTTLCLHVYYINIYAYMYTALHLHVYCIMFILDPASEVRQELEVESKY